MGISKRALAISREEGFHMRSKAYQLKKREKKGETERKEGR